MNTLSPENKAATKVIAKACNWADRRKAAQKAPEGERRRAHGRLVVSGDELAEAVEKYRKLGER